MSAVDATLPAAAAGLSQNLATTALTLARRFGAGATLWCVSPRWAWHGEHVAVEFVHPVVVGKRALPAEHLAGADLAGALRLLGRAGDVVLAVSGADDPVVLDLLRRAEAWGLTRVWLGAGPSPPGGHAVHIVWLGDCDAAVAATSGDLVLLYHLLWELTHVVFEHPGLLAAADPSETTGTAEVCVTCSDQSDIAEVRALQAGGRAEVVARGQVQEVDISLIDRVKSGDLIMIHAGIAIAAVEADLR
jgi:hydrogenase maturation factor